MIWPAFRDLCVQIPSMQANMSWFVDMSIYEQCEWAGTVEGSLCHELATGRVDLIWEAKVSLFAAAVTCWLILPGMYAQP